MKSEGSLIRSQTRVQGQGSKDAVGDRGGGGLGNEAGLDEGGLTSEMFTLFFDGIVTPEFGLFECAGGDGADSRATSPADEDGSGSERLSGGQLTAFGDG